VEGVAAGVPHATKNVLTSRKNVMRYHDRRVTVMGMPPILVNDFCRTQRWLEKLQSRVAAPVGMHLLSQTNSRAKQPVDRIEPVLGRLTTQRAIRDFWFHLVHLRPV
jgi:hypothetical protein